MKARGEVQGAGSKLGDQLGVDFQILFERAPDGILLADAHDRRFLRANPEIQRMLGYTEAELLQLTVADIHPAADLPHALELFQQEVRREITRAHDVPVLRKDGSVFFADISAIPLSAQGRDYLFGFFHDSTKRKLAQEELRRSEQRFSYLVANTPAMIFSCRPDGDYEVTFVSENITLLLGFHPHEFTADPGYWKKHIHPADMERVMAGLQHARLNHGTHTLEFRYRRKDGTYGWMHNELRVVHAANGQPSELIGFWIDISARKLAEEAQVKLEAQNRQLQKSESLGRMAGAIAHHYNNQLQVVLGNLELAMDSLPRGAVAREHLLSAEQAARQAAKVSAQMLAYLGQSSGEKQALDLSETCRQKMPLIQSAMPVVLDVDLATPGPVISGNANQIHQVLLNLVTNAWESAGPNRGAIRMSVSTVAAADIPNGYRRPIGWQPSASSYACLEVADAGCGIAGADLEQLFDPFFSRKFTGRGLGLPVVLGIVRAHGGGITVETELGHGSSFRVYFPLIAHAALAPDRRAAPAPEFKAGGTVLVVEDVDSVRALAAHVLGSLGFNVLTAPDGLAALEVYRAHQADIRCVLCDLSMPRMNGWQTIAALRQISPDVPVILASGHDEAIVMAEKHPEQPQLFLGKPYDRDKLRAALGQVLAGRPG